MRQNERRMRRNMHRLWINARHVLSISWYIIASLMAWKNARHTGQKVSHVCQNMRLSYQNVCARAKICITGAKICVLRDEISVTNGKKCDEMGSNLFNDRQLLGRIVLEKQLLHVEPDVSPDFVQQRLERLEPDAVLLLQSMPVLSQHLLQGKAVITVHPNLNMKQYWRRRIRKKKSLASNEITEFDDNYWERRCLD